MASLKSLKLRIKSIKSTQKITKAMKMVAASKLKRAREAAEAAAPYADRLGKIMISVAHGYKPTSEDEISLMTGTGSDRVHLIIVAASDRGLCGGFNGSIIKAAKAKIAHLEATGKHVKLFCIGKKSYDLLKRQYASKIIAHVVGRGKKGVSFEEAFTLSKQIQELFENRKFDVCHIIYNKFKTAILSVVTDQRLIPLEMETEQQGNYQEEDALIQEKPATLYEFEPSEEEILEVLLPKNIAVQIFRALLDNNASEQGARMTAMDNATRNSGELIKKLTLLYNRSRQAQITRELIEIISGAEAI